MSPGFTIFEMSCSNERMAGFGDKLCVHQNPSLVPSGPTFCLMSCFWWTEATTLRALSVNVCQEAVKRQKLVLFPEEMSVVSQS